MRVAIAVFDRLLAEANGSLRGEPSIASTFCLSRQIACRFGAAAAQGFEAIAQLIGHTLEVGGAAGGEECCRGNSADSKSLVTRKVASIVSLERL
ncbi:MAG TPA: hypothetical protein VEZ50_10845 [Nodosilinea sp.]|nr:hypothetical protein [Nodosilinea sp.]